MTNLWTRITSWFGRPRQECPECHAKVTKAEAFCDVCGHDIVQNARDANPPRPPV